MTEAEQPNNGLIGKKLQIKEGRVKRICQACSQCQHSTRRSMGPAKDYAFRPQTAYPCSHT